MATFLKLDTGVIGNFDAALGDCVTVVDTALLRVLQRLARGRGWPAALALWVRSKLAPGSAARAMVAGNVDRKRIRLPAVFGNSVVSGIYEHIKAGQAMLLHAALQDTLATTEPDIVIVYNGSVYPESVLADVSVGRTRVFVEGGFFPGTLQIDPAGLNGANSVPRDPAFYLETADDFAAGGLPDAVNNRASKASGDGAIVLEPGFVFVPFQVPSDMQVTLHSPWVRDMEMFLDVVIAAAERNPDDTFVIKEHPSFKRSVKGLRPGHPRVIFANDNVTSDLIRDARVVVTLNSTVGIEALLFDRPVITLGKACYNIEGLVLHAEGPEALDKALTQARGWSHNERLRHQFLGYLWQRYLVRGRYDDLPDDLATQVEARAEMGGNLLLSGSPGVPVSFQPKSSA
ncbi:nitrogen fixation protein FixF [uncultured Tateyamaria sp.]|uniref:capsular polysaccharide export protein, LipB/KpsS family n=1 Tax=uncultured Tateyamaria sp. TaxID=455651 RepID=UPI002604CCAF|nr:nitrogen fixation protein FixF [uncultured Tateyamaria sp.]